MKRSEINQYIQEAKEIFAKYSFFFATQGLFSPAEWAHKGAEYNEILNNMLVQDVTDFGLGDFEKAGELLFTVQRGHKVDIQ